MNKKTIFVTIVLAVLAIICVLWAGLTVAGVDVIEKISTIFQGKIEATDIAFKSNSLTLGVGQKADMEIITAPENAETTYKFSSTDNRIVSTQDNNVKAVSQGSCTIKVTSDNGLTDYCDVTVTPAPKKLSIAQNLSVALSESYTFKPSTDVDLSPNTLTYESSDESVATISNSGVLTPIKTGKTTITAKSYNGLSSKCSLTICETPLTFTLSGGSLTITEGKTSLLSCDFHKGDGAATKKFATSDKRVATVSQNGTVRGISEGNATITCTLFNGVSARCEVTVTSKLAGIRTNLDKSKPMVALTFDDGPKSNNTQSILNTLAKYNGRATFFVVGSRVEDEADTLKKVYDAGNEIGNHSWDHQYADDLTKKQQMDEITKTNKAVKEVTGSDPTLFRCPGGISCSVYEKYSNMPLIMWSIDTLDWSTKNSKSTYKAITKVFKKNENLDGDIVLMHDIQNSTPKAVKYICNFLNKKGYQFVTVSELAYYKGYEMKNGETYSSFYN